MAEPNRRRAWADIDLGALRANLARVRDCNSQSRITAIIKANAYGHGLARVAAALGQDGSPVACFGVATVDEATVLHGLGTGRRILVLQGFANLEQARYLVEAGLEFVIHADYQLALLKRALRDRSGGRPLTVWLKLDTGMHRLGLNSDEFRDALDSLQALPQVSRIVLMSHLACADDPGDEAAVAMTRLQLDRFQSACSAPDVSPGMEISRSLAASAGVMAWPATHFEYLRPGIMLYGGSPFTHKTGLELGLQPVMNLRARLIAIKTVAAGDSVGYGATYTCDKATRIGVVAIGYGDGYPRKAPNDTPVLVQTPRGLQRSRLIGRVSMDMLTIDLDGFDDVEVGGEVVLWGDTLAADEIAGLVGTISYELFCQVTDRVPFNYY